MFKIDGFDGTIYEHLSCCRFCINYSESTTSSINRPLTQLWCDYTGEYKIDCIFKDLQCNTFVDTLVDVKVAKSNIECIGNKLGTTKRGQYETAVNLSPPFWFYSYHSLYYIHYNKRCHSIIINPNVEIK